MVLKVAVTPVGTPDTAKFTMPLKPFWAMTVNALLPLLPPATRLRLPSEAESVKPCCGTVNVRIVELWAVPDVPVTVTRYLPAAVVLLMMKVNESVEGLTVAKFAVMPAGTPDAAKLTRSARPIALVTATLIGSLYPARRVKPLADDVRLKLGAGMVTTIVVVLAVVPEVPLIVIGYVPATAEALAVTVSVIGLVALATGQLS